jgi:hypothetical protein
MIMMISNFLFGRAPAIHSSFFTRHCERSEAISKELSRAHTRLLRASPSQRRVAVDGSGRAATGFAIASAIPSLRSGQCRRFASLTAALRIPHATHPYPLSFEKREGRYVLLYLLLFPLSNSIREGGIKGVSKTPHPSRIPPTIVGGYSY